MNATNIRKNGILRTGVSSIGPGRLISSNIWIISESGQNARRLDETYAPASENLGSLVLNESTGKYEIADVGADAKVVLDRGVILTNADVEPVGGDVFGPQSFHNGDYALFFNNIKDNVAKRIEAYRAK